MVRGAPREPTTTTSSKAASAAIVMVGDTAPALIMAAVIELIFQRVLKFIYPP